MSVEQTESRQLKDRCRRSILERFSIAWMTNLAQRRGTRNPPPTPPSQGGESRRRLVLSPPCEGGVGGVFRVPLRCARFVIHAIENRSRKDHSLRFLLPSFEAGPEALRDNVVNYVCRDRADHIWQFGMRSNPACRPRRTAVRGCMLMTRGYLAARYADCARLVD